MEYGNIFLIFVIVFVIGYVLYIRREEIFGNKTIKKQEATEKKDGKETDVDLLAWIKKPWVYIILILIVFNFIIWIKIPWLWTLIYDNILGFFAFNLIVWLIFFLRSIKTKDSSGKETKEINQSCLLFSNIAIVILSIAFVTGAIKNKDKIWEKKSSEEEIVKFVDAPADRWSEKFYLPKGDYNIYWGDNSEPFQMMNNCNLRAVFDPQNPEDRLFKEQENIPYKKGCQSTWYIIKSGNGAPVKVKFTFVERNK